MAELREVTSGEVEEFLEVMTGAFGERREPWHDREFRRRVPLESTVAAFEDGRLVGTSAALPLTLSLPGGSGSAAGITAVGVLPTHRRRGLLRAMMDAQLRKARSAGQPVSILWASEGSIYGRFGFGPASRRLRVSFETAGASLSEEGVSGPLRLVGRDEALRLMPAVYEHLLESRPGLLRRDEIAWEYLTADENPDLPAAEARHFFVVHGETPDGYLIYRVRPGTSSFGPRDTALVTELVADGPGPARDLWKYLLNLDLVSSVEAPQRPVDESLIWMLRDPQGLGVVWRTGIWARLLDVPLALACRGYQEDGDLVLQVTDPFIPAAAGRFHLRVRGGVGTCAPTEKDADLRLGVSELSSGYLGQHCYGALSRAGQIEEASPGAALRADRIMGWDPPPWCLDDF